MFGGRGPRWSSTWRSERVSDETDEDDNQRGKSKSNCFNAEGTKEERKDRRAVLVVRRLGSHSCEVFYLGTFEVSGGLPGLNCSPSAGVDRTSAGSGFTALAVSTPKT